MITMYNLKQKEIINIKDGCRYGFVSDIIIDESEGNITKLIVPGPGRVFGFFGKEAEYQIDWADVRQIGDDIILVEVDSLKILKDYD